MTQPKTVRNRLSKLRNRSIMAGTLVVAVALMSLLSGLFVGSGGSGDKGNGEPTEEASEANVAGQSSPPREAAETPEQAEIPEFQPSEVLHVLVDGQRFHANETYLIKNTSSGAASHAWEASVDQIVGVVQQTPGDAAGIRVKIQQCETSFDRAVQRLEQALLGAGVVQGEIYFVDETAPLPQQVTPFDQPATSN